MSAVMDRINAQLRAGGYTSAPTRMQDAVIETLCRQYGKLRVSPPRAGGIVRVFALERDRIFDVDPDGNATKVAR